MNLHHYMDRRAFWKAHYHWWPWCLRWLTRHWWKARIWEANHPGFHPGCIQEEVWFRERYWGPFSKSEGYVPYVDTRTAEQMFKQLEEQQCHTFEKNDGNT